MPEKKNAPALGGVSGAIKSEPNPYEGEQTVTSLPKAPEKFPLFDLRTRHARITVQSERDYWIADGGYTDRANYLTDAGDLVRLTDDQDAHLLLSPAEALSVAAALSAVATHLLEEPREITRRTEPGAPKFEEGI